MTSWLEPLHDADSMRAADAWAIEEQGVPSLELMEAAGIALARETERLAAPGPVRVVCGKGNNGGDGLVAARHLAEPGHSVEVLLCWPRDELSGDAAANLERFAGTVRELSGRPDEDLAGSGAVIDAIFGTGFSGAPRDPAAAAIAAINACPARVIAADIASGVDASTGETAGAAVEADATVTFHAAKLGHWIAPGKRCRGELTVSPIGIPPGAPSANGAGGLIGPAALELPVPRGAASTKFSSGQVLIAGGSPGLTGAVCMAAQASGRAGAGYASVAVPDTLERIFEIKLTEVMSIGCPSDAGHLGPAAADAIAEATERAGAVVLGPGLGRGAGASELVAALVDRIAAPLVLDADGLNAVGQNLEQLAARRGPTVLTPHAGELGRLLGIDSDEVGARRLEFAREAARRAQAVVVLKGDDTIVVDAGGEPAVNGLESPALATAGTGDVLSGMIAALLARGLEAREAAATAVYAHARAGRIAAHRAGAPEAVVAGDVIAAIGHGLRPGPEAPE